MDFATLASASHLSREDRRAYLKAMETEAKAQRQRDDKEAREELRKRWATNTLD